MTQKDQGSVATFSFLKTTGIKIYQRNLWKQEPANCSFVCLSAQTYLVDENFEANAQPQYLTWELRSVSKLFGLFQVLFVFSLFLHTQAQYFMSLNWNNLYYHTGKCANYEFTCANENCLAKYKRCGGENNCGDNSDEQQCRKFVITVTVVLILQSPFL